MKSPGKDKSNEGEGGFEDTSDIAKSIYEALTAVVVGSTAGGTSSASKTIGRGKGNGSWGDGAVHGGAAFLSWSARTAGSNNGRAKLEEKFNL